MSDTDTALPTDDEGFADPEAPAQPEGEEAVQQTIDGSEPKHTELVTFESLPVQLGDDLPRLGQQVKVVITGYISDDGQRIRKDGGDRHKIGIRPTSVEFQ